MDENCNMWLILVCSMKDWHEMCKKGLFCCDSDSIALVSEFHFIWVQKLVLKLSFDFYLFGMDLKQISNACPCKLHGSFKQLIEMIFLFS